MNFENKNQGAKFLYKQKKKTKQKYLETQKA